LEKLSILVLYCYRLKNLKLDSIPQEARTYFEELRVKLAFRMSAMFLCIFSILSYTRYFESMESFSMMAVATVISAICLVIMRVNNNNYLLVFYIYVICGYIIIAFSLMVYHTRIHLVDVLWLMTVVFLAFFTLGRKLGYLLLFSSICILGIFIFFHLNNQILLLKAFTIYQKISLLIELIGAFSLNFYLFYLFLAFNRYSERKLLESYDQVKDQNTKILLQNEEKTMLVREIHHRVKNNLQIVVSLLRMQSQEVDNPEFRGLFQESINRIMAMSMIHQKLYQNDNLSQIKIGDYLDELIHEIMNLSFSEQSVRYEIKTEVGKIGLKTLIPIGLLVNELVSNSLKHAFEDRSKARIRIEIQKEGENRLRILYFDNGVWKPQVGNSSFGLILIDTLIEQLEGTKEVLLEENGTTYSISVLNLEERDILA
jgi:two-component system, sensor histidine kinase PdtaS